VSTDVLVIGGGPAGAAAAYWLADAGHDVTVVERRTFPRSKACGDVLTPRAVRQLHDMGLANDLDRWHRLAGIRVIGHGRQQLIEWPGQGGAGTAIVARRREIDQVVLANAATRGATVLEGHEAIEPIVERGFVRGARVRTVDGSTQSILARYIVVADGASSRFGRALGTFRTRHLPVAAAIRSYWPSVRDHDDRLEIVIDLTDRDGIALPAYGWVAPAGDGTVNVGVGLLSTARDFKGTNVAHLLDQFTADIAVRWDVDPGAATGVVRVARVPLGGSVQPTAAPTFLVVGDAAGVANPFTGAGVDTAYETGRMAAGVLDEALGDGGPTALQRYPRLLAEGYSNQYRGSSLWSRLVAQPAATPRIARAIVRSPRAAEWVARHVLGATPASLASPVHVSTSTQRSIHALT
jgi:menaquinone-9 beta-reductase